MTTWNAGYFLVVKRWWMGAIIIFLAGLAVWGFVDLLRRCQLPLWYRRLCSTAARLFHRAAASG